MDLISVIEDMNRQRIMYSFVFFSLREEDRKLLWRCCTCTRHRHGAIHRSHAEHAHMASWSCPPQSSPPFQSMYRSAWDACRQRPTRSCILRRVPTLASPARRPFRSSAPLASSPSPLLPSCWMQHQPKVEPPNGWRRIKSTLPSSTFIKVYFFSLNSKIG